ncbi:type IV pilus biogenesis protein PilM [Paenibacillus sp. SI8]|uniref:type IV pilus biogenesis protein PilM n=1 Tax=unclassified Paenibacillus TaxID=185978 RepID=UPI003467E6E2
MLNNMLRKLVAHGRGNKSYIGIEFTDYSYKWAEVASQQTSPPRVLGYGTEIIQPGCIQNGRIVDQRPVLQSLQKLVSEKKVKTNEVHFVVPSALSMLRFLKFPDLPDKELGKLVQFEINNHLHFPFARPFYDFVNLNGTASTVSSSKSSSIDNENDANLIDVMLAAVEGNVVEAYTELLTSAKLRPISAEIKALSLYRLMNAAYAEEMPETLLAVDITENNADLIIIHQGKLQLARNVPIRALTRLSEDVRLQPKKEDLEHHYEELVDEMDRLIKFYRYTLNHRDHEVSCVYVSGDIRDRKVLQRVLSEQIQTEFRMVSNQLFISEPGLESYFPMLTVSLGAAMRGGAL